MTSITKKAYARGIGEALQRRGVVQFHSPSALKTASDSAAGYFRVEPAESAVPNDDCIKVAQHIIRVNSALRSRGKTASYPQSVSIGQSSSAAFGDMITKLAAEVMEGSTAVGLTTHENTLEQAAAQSDLGMLELMERPLDYAMIEPGEGNVNEVADAIIGLEQPHPLAPDDVVGSNSVVDASKTASVAQMLRKLGMSDNPTAVGLGSHQNDLATAATTSDLGMLEEQARPDDYARIFPGEGNIGESAAAQIGTEQPHPGAPNDTSGTNSVVEATKEAQIKLAHARALGQKSVLHALSRLSR